MTTEAPEPVSVDKDDPGQWRNVCEDCGRLLSQCDCAAQANEGYE